MPTKSNRGAAEQGYNKNVLSMQRLPTLTLLLPRPCTHAHTLQVAVQRSPAGAPEPMADRRPQGPQGPRVRGAGPSVRRVRGRGSGFDTAPARPS